MTREHAMRWAKPLVAAVLLIAIGVGLGWWLHRPQGMSEPGVSERPVLYWYDPMVPQQRFDKPGKSPFMDMQLVPRYADEAETSEGVVVSASTQQNLGIRLATVQRIAQHSEFAATGVLTYSEREVAIVQARVAGYVQSARLLAAGERVAAGAAIAELVLPDWTAAEQDWLVVRTTGDAQLVQAGRDRLHALGIDESEIRRLEAEGSVRRSFSVRAPRAGIVQAVEIRQGMSVAPGQTLIRINDTAVVWLDIAVPEAFAASVQVGDPVVAHSVASPSPAFEGKVAAVLPALDPTSRTLPVRVELRNADGRLRPGQSVQVSLKTGVVGEALAVPTEAVIRTGRRSLVIVSENGSFRPVEVTLGAEISDQTIIASGLEAGQQVVASGQFLLDSEASLRGVGSAAMEDQP